MTWFPSTWRLVWEPEPRSGPWNMGVDEALLEAVLAGTSPPVLRLYAWAPPCLSLGRHQAFDEVEETTLARNGWMVVRRPTGGRAILHTDELTYAVLAPASEPRVQGDVLTAYRNLAQGLLRALELLGLTPEWQQHRGPWQQEREHPVCFQVPAVYEITVQGRKILGSAQVRRLQGVLQHGTLPLTGDITRIVQVLRWPDEQTRHRAAEKLRQQAITLEEALGRPVTWEQAAEALVEGFRQALKLTFIRQPLTPQERARAQQLVAQKYGHPAWTRWGRLPQDRER